MKNFRNGLKKIAKRYFTINIILSLIVLLIAFPLQFIEDSPESGTGMEAWAGFIFLIHLAFLIPYYLLCSLCFLFFKEKLFFNKSNIFLTYLIPSILGLLLIISLNNFNINYITLNIIINIIPGLTFFLGQIISLFLILKFIKEYET